MALRRNVSGYALSVSRSRSRKGYCYDIEGDGRPLDGRYRCGFKSEKAALSAGRRRILGPATEPRGSRRKYEAERARIRRAAGKKMRTPVLGAAKKRRRRKR